MNSNLKINVLLHLNQIISFNPILEIILYSIHLTILIVSFLFHNEFNNKIILLAQFVASVIQSQLTGGNLIPVDSPDDIEQLIEELNDSRTFGCFLTGAGKSLFLAA